MSANRTLFVRGLAVLAPRLVPLAGLAAIMLAERGSSLRRMTQATPRRAACNLIMGAMSIAVVSGLEEPVTARLAARAETRRRGLVQHLPLPEWARDALAVLAMDYTIYLWHVLTHKVPLLWRFHLVHHIDLDLDASTGLRFHAADMLISIPYRAAQVALIGTSRRALHVWQGFFFASVVFHHSNIRLPFRIEQHLARVLTTPSMHGIHHSATREQTDSNWSSGLSLWDRLHGTFRLDVSQKQIRIGVPGYPEAAETRLWPSLSLPFVRQRNAWTPPGTPPGTPHA